MTTSTAPPPDTVGQASSGTRAPRLLTGAGDDLDRHRQIHGALPSRGADLIAMAQAAGLTGRGGAAFPSARKLAATDRASGVPVVIANGAEGEPLSRKDAVLLDRSPHLVLDGLSAAVSAIGADAAYLCVPTHRVARLEAVIRARRGSGWDATAITVIGTPGRFVDGEKSALIDRIAGGPGVPRDQRRGTAVAGLNGRPTLVHNVETLAHLALIARGGPRWFRERGTADEPGTMLVTLGGVDAIDGVLEVDMGTPMGAVLRRVPSLDPADLRAVLVGGFHGTWIGRADVGRLSMSARTLSSVGASPGAGVLRYLRRDECGLSAASAIVDYLAGETAGQCGPCRFGLPALAAAMAELLARGGAENAARVVRLADTIDKRGACSHPDGTARMVRSACAVFADDAAAHAMGRCSATGGRR
ncbi:NADH-ubiquinone oxidoreductase-F iron-sulfur binding region domain-containing protein [Williamsia sp.]|uniref:NADH-ubiquinone oxidoreductase-F iron-sulfur binding region domain-containing protein n=1 Tax=Williamsia sp. TaxID=1872085 RepID=UPI001A17FB05|nr:NADH-ubiquinone oxidoreductase-F iron-sulfur binding region domain-containing protein [Williamsia sp.]MBJ7291086.1 NADH-quinone oxidoreductase subunit F [Williamsia sp.]